MDENLLWLETKTMDVENILLYMIFTKFNLVQQEATKEKNK